MRYRYALTIAVVVAVLCFAAVRMLRSDPAARSLPIEVPCGPFDEATSRYPLPTGEPVQRERSPAAAGGLRIAVRDSNNHIVAGANVFALRERAGPRGRDAILDRGKTDDNGICTLDPSADVESIDLTVVADGFRPEYRPGIPLRAGTVVVRLRAGARIRGQVVDGGGRPLADVRVHALAPGIPRTHTSLFAAPVPGHLDRGGAQTGSDGKFVIAGLGEGTRYSLFALKDGFAAPPGFEHRVDAVLPGADPVRLVLHPAYRLRYRVIDPVTGEMPADPRLWPDPVSKGTDLARATYAAGIPPEELSSRPPWDVDELWVFPEERPSIGPIRISLSFPGYRPFRGEVEALRYRSGNDNEPAVLKLERDESWRETGRLTLRFIQPDGSPVIERASSGTVPICVLRAAAGAKEGLEFRFAPDRDGTMVFRKVPPRRYYFISRIGIVTKSLKLTSFEVRSGDEAEATVRFPFLGTAVFNLPDGMPVPPHIALELNRVPAYKHPFREFALAFKGRRATLPYLPEGRYTATARGYGVLARPFAFAIEADRTTRIRLDVPEAR